MNCPSNTERKNVATARKLFGRLSTPIAQRLMELTRVYRLSVMSGDLLLLNGVWYLTHSGLLSLARREGCRGIRVETIQEFCNANTAHWMFKATVFRSQKCRGFVGYGDANPSNVSALVRGAEMRIAETRAVNRALRKAYGIGICSVEELGSATLCSANARKMPPSSNRNGNGDFAGPRLRDRLCQLIREHRLDANLVKSYAVDFCGTKTLRDATRQQVEAFVAHLADWAEKDRNALLCQLNSYLPSPRKDVAPDEDRAGAA